MRLYKPRKPMDESKSFRPFAFLSLISKLNESLLLSVFTEYPLKEHQHYLRAEYSTTIALNVVTNDIQKGPSTLLVALDLTAAFDTVDQKLQCWCNIANALQHLHEQAAFTPKDKNTRFYADNITLPTSHPQVEKLRYM